MGGYDPPTYGLRTEVFGAGSASSGAVTITSRGGVASPQAITGDNTRPRLRDLVRPAPATGDAFGELALGLAAYQLGRLDAPTLRRALLGALVALEDVEAASGAPAVLAADAEEVVA